MMIFSLAIIAAIFVAGLTLIKMNHFRHRMTIIALLFLALFVYSTIMLVNSSNDFDLKSTEGVFQAVKVYTGWLGNGFTNLKIITGNAIGMDWSSTNGTFFSKEVNSEKR